MTIEWKLRKMMAKRDIWSGSELLRLMEEKAGYSMSPASISALMNDKPKLVRVDTLDAICTALDCSPDEIIIHKPSYIGNIKPKKTISEKEDSKKVSNDRELPPI